MTTAIHLQFDYLGQHTPNHPFEQKDHLELEPEFKDNSHIDIFCFKRMASVIFNFNRNTMPNKCTRNKSLPYSHTT